MYFKEQYEDIKKIAEDIYYHPELGYKELHTKDKVIQKLIEINSEINIEEFSTTGFRVTLGEAVNKKLNIAIIAELDAVYAPSHMYADKDSGAAHNCGHYAQVAIALALYSYLYKSQVYQSYDYNITFVFVPAEEYLDLDYRDELMSEKVISHYGGKPEAMKLGVFDDIDIAICVHAIGGEFEERTIETNCDLAGFLYKKYDFIGEASHAGFDPSSSINAYSMSTLFHTALGLMRQQIDDSEKVRMNPIVTKSNMSTNVIPNAIQVGTDLRTKSTKYMMETAEKIDNAAKGSALALQGEVDITTKMGYLPFVQNRYLSEFVIKTFDNNHDIPRIMNENMISAAGDIGDLSYMIPSIQIGHSGFTGTIHGDNFIDIDPEFIFEIFPRFLSEVLDTLNGAIDPLQLYKRSYNEYKKLINSIVAGDDHSREGNYEA